MMQHAWNNHTEHPPMNRNFYVSAVSTLYIMNLTKEYNEARSLIETTINDRTDFETINVVANWVSDSLGGILSVHALSGDSLYRQRITYMANRTIPMLPVGIPKSDFDADRNYALAGGMLLEFHYLNKITTGPNPTSEVVSGIRRFIEEQPSALLFTNDLWNTTQHTFTRSCR